MLTVRFEYRLPDQLQKELGRWFREFYSEAPWDERWRCPKCSPVDDFGPAGRYADAEMTHCPVCGTSLVPYWSDERTLKYYESAMALPGAWLIVGWDNENVAAWTWGYQVGAVAEFPALPGNGAYYDIIGVLPDYRGGNGSYDFSIASCEMLFEAGYDFLVTRTHKVARHVATLMLRIGWRRLKLASASDDEREYWIYQR